ncbi:hypothetical protein [Microbacterium sp. TNHR37B]|uniref:hypothetical protein n=1 Tax=Microbacterium sp. TNHR37B TaxID=1775956 RepID=UPI0007B2D2EA|nr:hypothetical protein [Microbacterium sp. TNHR37B]KZE91831.1 hypothetical protein AVP41_01380 [Microbacterium sp. TNHR37B]
MDAPTDPAATDPAPTAPAPRKPDRALLVVVGVIVAIVIVALVVVFTRGEGEPLDEGTPAGVVQRYTQAVLDGDRDAATRYLIADLAEDCGRVDPGPVGDTRMTLLRARERADTATVDVSLVTRDRGGLFGAGEYQQDDAFSLEKEGGAWRIRTSPWIFTICEEAVS